MLATDESVDNRLERMEWSEPQIRIVPTNSIFIPGNLVWVRIGYAVCTMQCAVIPRACVCVCEPPRTHMHAL